MAMGFATTLRNSRLTLISTAIDAGSGAGTLKIYTATRPATGAAITTQTLLATLSFADPCIASAASSGVLTFDTIASVTAVADGTAAWARAAASDGTFVADFSVTATGGGGDVTLNSTGIVSGGSVVVTSATITEGNA